MLKLKVLNPLIKAVAKKAYVAPKIEVQTIESLGFKMEQLAGDTITIAKKTMPAANAEFQTGIKKDNIVSKYLKEHFGRDIKLDDLPMRNDNYLVNMPDGCINSCAFGYIMDIGSKERAIEFAKFNPQIAKNMELKPHLFNLTEEQEIAKQVLDEAFEKVTPNSTACLVYRGIHLSSTNPAYKILSKLKRGDIYKEPYIYASVNQNYAFGNYACKSVLHDVSVKYHILLPEGTKMLCTSSSEESVLKGMFKVCDVIKDGKDLEFFVEHVK